MRIAVLREDASAEPRVAATPETVKKFIAAGAAVWVETGAGAAAGISDQLFQAAGAEIAPNAAAALADADLVLKVRRPDDAAGYKRGAAVVALMDPYGN
jgi:NAD(P) transhydrogenase subunit alpha